MIHITKKQHCNGCHACANSCPKDCIVMTEDEEGFLYPKVQEELCISCGLCQRVCPLLHTSTLDNTQSKQPQIYAVQNQNEAVLKASSSGGMFTVIAEYVLSLGGVVFGAAFDEHFCVKHTYTQTMEGLAAFRGSKYVQSEIGKSYRQAQAFLEEGKYVLFTGTPCQIGGLLSYLKKPYEKLYTQDIICHGVPSPAVWKKYLAYRKKKARGANVSNVNFRDKTEGWKSYRITVMFDGKKIYTKRAADDPMMKVFLQDLCLRPSCHDCAFKTLNRNSDFTLADFWGVEKVQAEAYDGRGTSLVFIHSEKGEELFKRLTGVRVWETQAAKALAYNPAMMRSAPQKAARDEFMKTIQSRDFGKTSKFWKQSFWKKCKIILSKIKHKILRSK